VFQDHKIFEVLEGWEGRYCDKYLEIGIYFGYIQGILGENVFHIQTSWCHKGDIFFLSMVFWGLSEAPFHYAAHDN
jgi:hypothetical protein